MKITDPKAIVLIYLETLPWVSREPITRDEDGILHWSEGVDGNEGHLMFFDRNIFKIQGPVFHVFTEPVDRIPRLYEGLWLRKVTIHDRNFIGEHETRSGILMPNKEVVALYDKDHATQYGPLTDVAAIIGSDIFMSLEV